MSGGRLAALAIHAAVQRWTAIITRTDSSLSAALIELKKTLACEIAAVVPLMGKLAGGADRLGEVHD